MKLGAIEAGGTKFVCAVSDDNIKIEDREQFPTTTPEETMAQVFAYFEQHPVDAIGIGSFGPVSLNEDADDYGHITNTPKLAWKNYNFLGAMKAHFDIPFYFTTDVNVAAYGEYKAGAGRGKKNILYWTVGTGVGASYIQHGKFLQGYSHPEMGHILLRPDERDNGFKGVCPYHGNCFEGLAAGLSIEKRFGKKGYEIDPSDEFWEIEAKYIAQACVNATLILRPDIIIFGGGVMKQSQLFPQIQAEFVKQLADYVDFPEITGYIKHVALGDDAGITGALMLAKKALQEIKN
ncbi:ROK family protein [Pediococcus siamensis]|uniref:ROK family protein n=1 Tax=Pediococcus siamensis TaxID=381829 RepID=UPI0039A23EB5